MREMGPGAAPSVLRPSAALVTPTRLNTAARAWMAWLLGIASVCALAVGSVVGTRWWWYAYVAPGPAPTAHRLDLYRRVADLTPITVTIGGAQVAPWRTTVDDLRRNRTLWRAMYLENWNTVPAPLREDILDRILTVYRPLLMNPRTWDQMTPADWDDVPQPIRTVAYRQMVAYWVGFYDVGGAYRIDPRQIRDTLQAIAMSESWMDHRAHRIDFTGNRDIGLVQASDYARERMRELAQAGVVDVSFTDEEYWNPWKASRFLSMWMVLLLQETDGDLSRAVRAYNRGLASADDPAGYRYLMAVERRRRRFIQNEDAPPAWTWLWQRARAIEAEEWPWLHGHTSD